MAFFSPFPSQRPLLTPLHSMAVTFTPSLSSTVSSVLLSIIIIITFPSASPSSSLARSPPLQALVLAFSATFSHTRLFLLPFSSAVSPAQRHRCCLILSSGMLFAPSTARPSSSS
ncbi:hypothetical protein EX30DRAFT_172833 [Ascodesmis nigricans]|uniref:Uncharacterized protein n=1 Tax=Ascodesmis nigricans TaxID=341454 RepID=A0A4S2MLH1_9PEZI|nr:hypothetical protein EX30DRAFT_172833 [Ascodesmis nigricans]